MTEISTENKVVLGYHSPTEWVFYPEVFALYDCILINQVVYEKVINEGENTISIYRRTKAELMKTLVHKGILFPTNYPCGENEQEQLKQLVDYFFSQHEGAMRQLLVHAFEAFIEHEKMTLEKLIAASDPHWYDVAKQLPRLEHARNTISSGASLTVFPYQREIAKRYFEDAILTPVIFKDGYNPIFQWDGYAKFEQFLLKFRRGEPLKRIAIEKGAELYVLRSLSDILLPRRVITSPDNISQAIAQWDAFSGIRNYVADLNNRLWETIVSTSRLEQADQSTFINDFNSMLNIRMKSLNHQISQIDQEIEEAEASGFSKIVRLLIATLGSIVPGTGGMGQALDDAYSALIERNVKKNYSAFNAIFEYEHILDSLNSPQYTPVSISTIGKEYEAVEYWDQV